MKPQILAPGSPTRNAPSDLTGKSSPKFRQLKTSAESSSGSKGMARRLSTMVTGTLLGSGSASLRDETAAQQLEDSHDLLLNQFISVGYQKIGDGKRALQPFDKMRIFLDWSVGIANVTNVLFIPLQVAFSWPAYWETMWWLALLLDTIVVLDAVSYLFTGYFSQPTEDLLGEEEDEGEDEDQLQLNSPEATQRARKASFVRRASAVGQTDPTLTRVVKDAGIPKLVLIPELILLHYMQQHMSYDLMALVGIVCDAVRVRGGVALLLCLKIASARKAYKFTLPNLTTHSRRFKHLKSVSEGQAAILYYILYLVVFCHWVGCLFLFFAWQETSKGGKLSLLNREDSFGQYITAMYWALQTTLTVGYGDISTQRKTTFMTAFSCFIFVSSLLVGTFFTASTTVWLSNLDASQRKFKRKLHVLKEFMTVYRSSIPPNLRGKLYLYLDFNYRQNQSMNMMDELLEGMPKQVQTAVKLAATQDLIRKVKLFQNVSKSFISAIVMLLKPSVVLKGDTIFRHGDHGEEMYFLNRGHLSVMLPRHPNVLMKNLAGSPSGSDARPGRRHSPVLLDDPDAENWKQVASLKSGAYFGEIALFTNEHTRTATIQAVVNSTYFTLSREDFNRICPSFPDVGRILKNRAQSILQQNRSSSPTSKGAAWAGSSPGTPSTNSSLLSQERAVCLARLAILRTRATEACKTKKRLVPSAAAIAKLGGGASQSPLQNKRAESAMKSLKRGSIFVNSGETASTINDLAAGLGRIEDVEEQDDQEGQSKMPKSDAAGISPIEDMVQKEQMMELTGQLALIFGCREVLRRWNNAQEELDEEFTEIGADPDEVLLACRVVVDPNQECGDVSDALAPVADTVSHLSSRFEDHDETDLLVAVLRDATATVQLVIRQEKSAKRLGADSKSPIPVAVHLAAATLTRQLKNAED